MISEKEENVLASFFLRVGLAIAFIYAGIAAFLNPEAWIGFIPGFARSVIPASILLHIHSVFNVLLGIWLISNKKIFYASILACLAMVAIIVFNYSALDIVFRDIEILFAAIALTALSYQRR